MSGIELAEKAVKAAIVLEHDQALIDEIAALLGRAPLKRTELAASNAFSSHLSEEFSGLLKSAETFKGVPPLRDGFLPPGVHDATWSDLVSRYSSDANRAPMMPGMLHALHDLKESGVEKTYLGGSFVSAKVKPNDFDITFFGSFKPTIPRAYSKILGDRDLMKQAYGGECLEDHLDFFMHSRQGKAIGVLKVDMDSLAPRVDRSPAHSVYDGWRAANTKRIGMFGRMSTPTPKLEPFYTLTPR